MNEIYILLADGDGTMRSVDTPWGAAVTTEEEAKKYVKKGGVGYTHSYVKVKVFDTSKEAINIIYGDVVRKHKEWIKTHKGPHDKE